VSGYSPHTPADIAEMLAAIGVDSIGDLFRQVPARLRERAAQGPLPGMTEPELRAHLEGLASRNTAAGATSFLGAGAYAHWVPTVVDQILLRSEFATAYTPYQPEVSQGTLQAIFEFQTFSAILLGLDVANAQHVRRRVGRGGGRADGAPAPSRTAYRCSSRARCIRSIARRSGRTRAASTASTSARCRSRPTGAST
jgi:hypothetical protein